MDAAFCRGCPHGSESTGTETSWRAQHPLGANIKHLSLFLEAKGVA